MQINFLEVIFELFGDMVTVEPLHTNRWILFWNSFRRRLKIISIDGYTVCHSPLFLFNFFDFNHLRASSTVSIWSGQTPVMFARSAPSIRRRRWKKRAMSSSKDPAFHTLTCWVMEYAWARAYGTKIYEAKLIICFWMNCCQNLTINPNEMT